MSIESKIYRAVEEAFLDLERDHCPVYADQGDIVMVSNGGDTPRLTLSDVATIAGKVVRETCLHET